MTIPDYEATLTQPLTTDALIERRVASLVGRAVRRQLWFLFLDRDQVQLPLVMPFSDPPLKPDASVSTLARVIGLAVESENASSVIVVIERYADSVFTEADKEWARAIVGAFKEREVVVRSILISHRRGVRWFAQDDYGVSAAVG
jgi:hypothetical protein